MWNGRYRIYGGNRHKLYSYTCLKCGKECESHKKTANFCDRSCSNSYYKSGKDNHFWKGGRKMEQGYVFIHLPDHHRADSHGYVREHILVMEKKLGRRLKLDEIVHHINEIRNDNRPENLEVMTNSEHNRHHHLGARKQPILNGPIPDKDRFTVNEIAAMTNLTAGTINQRVQSGELESYKEKNLRFISRESLEDFIHG